MKTLSKEIRIGLAAVSAVLGLASVLTLSPGPLAAQSAAVALTPPLSSGGIFPLSQVRRGMTATAWTVFQGSKPEPMEVEILGVLRGARGPGHDMILVQLHGAKPEYTGVVAGMSGSPVYVGDRLLGSLSYRIGLFSKDPIAGITPIEQMLEVRDLPVEGVGVRGQGSEIRDQGSEIRDQRSEIGDQQLQGLGQETFQAMETPLTMSGFSPEATRFWQQRMAGTGLDTVAAGGMGASSLAGSGLAGSGPSGSATGTPISAAAVSAVVPGSAVSMQLVRGDLEIAATCTVTYIDPKQLLACGHPILQAGPVSLPMTVAEVVATLASPLNAFKIVNTGETIGAFTEDRDSGIRGVLGAQARMIPVHIAVRAAEKERKLNVDILDLPAVTPQAVMVTLYQALLETNESTFETSYHLTGSILLDGYPPSPLDLWITPGGLLPTPILTAVQTGERFGRLYSNGTRQGAVRGIDIHVEAIPRRMGVALESARLVSSGIVHAGDTVEVEATLRPWRQPARNVRIAVTLPARLGAGNLRLLISDSGTLDRALDQPRFSGRPPDLDTVLAQERRMHPADRVYASLLMPETQVGMAGQTLSSLPLSMANALEPLRAAQDVSLNGESAEVAGQAPAGGVLSGFQVLNLRIEPGGGLD